MATWWKEEKRGERKKHTKKWNELRQIVQFQFQFQLFLFLLSCTQLNFIINIFSLPYLSFWDWKKQYLSTWCIANKMWWIMQLPNSKYIKSKLQCRYRQCSVIIYTYLRTTCTWTYSIECLIFFFFFFFFTMFLSLSLKQKLRLYLMLDRHRSWFFILSSIQIRWAKSTVVINY